MAKLSEIFRATAEAIDLSTTKVNAHNDAMERYLGVLGQVAAAQSSLANDSAASAQRLLQQPTAARQASSVDYGPTQAPLYGGPQSWYFVNGKWEQAPVTALGAGGGRSGGPSGGGAPTGSPPAGGSSVDYGPTQAPLYGGPQSWYFVNGKWEQAPVTALGAKPESTSPQQAGNYTPPGRIPGYNFGPPHTLNGRGASTDQGAAPNPATIQTKGDSAIVSEVAKVGTAIKNLTTSMNRDPGNLRFRTAGLV